MFKKNNNKGFCRYHTAYILFNKGQRIPKGQSQMENPEKLAIYIYGTQDEEKEKQITT